LVKIARVRGAPLVWPPERIVNMVFPTAARLPAARRREGYWFLNIELETGKAKEPMELFLLELDEFVRDFDAVFLLELLLLCLSMVAGFYTLYTGCHNLWNEK
jgi:hypothetical protein